jgi:hypothetical protein
VTGINTGRVLVGGIVAGIVINVSEFVLNTLVLGAAMQTALAKMNLPPVGGAAMGLYTVFGFALGIAAVWLYAAIRPRYGAGVTTALCAGATMWFFAYFYPSVGMAVMGMFPVQPVAIGLAWGLVEALLATVAGAYFYKEA